MVRVLPKLDPQAVLMSINQIEVFRDLIPSASTTSKFCNTLRSDRNPGCWLYDTGQIWILRDLACSQFDKKNIIQLWMQVYNLTYKQAVRKIYEKYIEDKKLSLTPLEMQNKITKENRETPFSAYERSWEKTDLSYWGDVFTIQDLELNGLRPTWYFETQSRKTEEVIIRYSSSTEPLYHWNFVSGHQKVYSPLARVKEFRFIGNANTNDYYFEGDWDPRSNRMLLTSSWKDGMTVRKHIEGGINLRALNGESYYPPDKLISELRHFNEIIVCLDADKTGWEWNKNLTQYINSHFPDRCRFIDLPKLGGEKDKDFYDYRKFMGKENFTQFINQLL